MTRVCRPIEFRSLCAIARVTFLQQPSMDDAEWKAAIKDTCAAQDWEIPAPDLMARAMSAVEQALRKVIGPRVVGEAPAAPVSAQPDRAWTPADLKELAETIRRVQARSAGATPTNVLTVPRERWEISEPAALDEFYRQAAGDRLEAMRRFAEIAIVRPADWDVAQVRAQHEAAGGLGPGDCYGCRRPDRPRVRHHVIQIQHGGSNYVRNIAALCHDCHAIVHPWLPRVPRSACGFARLVDVWSVEALKAMFARAEGKRDAS